MAISTQQYTGTPMVSSAHIQTTGGVCVNRDPHSGNPVVDVDLGLQLNPTYAATMTLDNSNYSTFEITTTSAVGASTIGFLDGGAQNQEVFLIIHNDSSSGRTITFSGNCLAAGTLAGTTSKACTITFKSNGTSFYEVCRAGAAGGTSGM